MSCSSAIRRFAIVTGLFALCSASQLSGVGAQAADSAPTGEPLKSQAHELGKGVQQDSKRLAQGVQRDSKELGQQVRKDLHASSRQLRDAQRQFNATLHRFGRAMRAWWNRMRTQLASKPHSSDHRRSGPIQHAA
jgi:hypothetical protein